MIKKNNLLLEKYLEFIHANKNLSKNTILSYRNDLKEFLELNKKVSLANLGALEMNKYIKLLSQKFSSKTHCRKLSSVKSFFNYLLDSGIIIKNPTDITDKDKVLKNNKSRSNRFKYDLHGFTLIEANNRVKDIILSCVKNNYKERINKKLLILLSVSYPLTFLMLLINLTSISINYPKIILLDPSLKYLNILHYFAPVF